MIVVDDDHAAPPQLAGGAIDRHDVRCDSAGLDWLKPGLLEALLCCSGDGLLRIDGSRLFQWNQYGSIRVASNSTARRRADPGAQDR